MPKPTLPHGEYLAGGHLEVGMLVVELHHPGGQCGARATGRRLPPQRERQILVEGRIPAADVDDGTGRLGRDSTRPQTSRAGMSSGPFPPRATGVTREYSPWSCVT